MRRKHFWGQLPPEWGQPRRTASRPAARPAGGRCAVSADVCLPGPDGAGLSTCGCGSAALGNMQNRYLGLPAPRRQRHL